VAVVKTFTVNAGSAAGVFQSLGIAAAAAKSYLLMIYSASSSGLQLGDSNWATNPEAVMPQTFPMVIPSAQFAVSPGDDIYLVNSGSVGQSVTVFAQLR
jgi:hypothetical protein